MKFQIAWMLLWCALFSPLLTTEAFSQDKNLLGSAVAIDLEPKIGIPLAGYGSDRRRLPEFADLRGRYPEAFFFRPSEGRIDEIRAKTVVLQKGNKKIVFISMDTIGVTFRFINSIYRGLKKYGIKKEDIFVSGTHTHSGPGTLTRRLPLAVIAVDLFKRDNYNDVLRKTIKSVEMAIASLEPVELYETSFETEGIQKNKFRKKDEDHFDKRANFLLLKSLSSSRWLGGIINYAIHGGALSASNLKYSADIPGAIERAMEKKFDTLNLNLGNRPVFAFFNGAEGDVGTKYNGVEAMGEMADMFAEQSDSIFHNLKKVEPEFHTKRKRIWLGIPASPLKYCSDRNSRFWSKVPMPFRISLAPFMAQRAAISMLKIGHITMLTWPGEASTTLGFQLKDLAKSMGHESPWILGLTNDYMAYFTTKEEYHQAKYDSCSSLFNWRGGKRIIKAYKKKFL